ncbi:MAG TPA: zinc-binding alcohol dehydrogenase family protein [Polyangiaceae bacterium]|jgi:NADPH:quinone reductase-like Zn-dependent oxidoreductase
MRGLRFSHLGSLDALSYGEIPSPVRGEGDVRVQVRAAGINPSDVKNVLGRFPYTSLPRTPGRDFAGVVIEGPKGVVGTEVWGTGKELGFTRDGSHADEIVVPAAGIAPKPRALTFEEAAACGVPYTTAWDAIERTGITRGAKVLVIGIGAVGTAACGLVRARGAEILVAVRRPERLEELRKGGIPGVLLEEASKLETAVFEAFRGGADVVLDTTGHWLPAAVACLAPFGRVAVIAAPPDGHVHVPILSLYRRGGSVVGVNSLLYDTVQCARILAAVGKAFDDGSLVRPAAPVVRPLAEGTQAYRAIDAGTSDKIVLRAS